MDEESDYLHSMHHGIQNSNEMFEDNLKKCRHTIEQNGCSDQLSVIFNLNLDCFFSLFEWLSLRYM